jgi:CheY-like chemotaxis protein
MNILILDDDAMNRKVLRAILTAEGEDGLLALQTLEQGKVDAVISDILMLRLDGYRLCYEMRLPPTFNSLPFEVFYLGRSQ